MKKIHNLMLFISFLSLHAFGQEVISPESQKVIPPNPEAAGLGSYGDVPISYNTGTPNISIPIYNIKGKYIDLPISLNYDSKGNKVESIASWVGLGWTLNAGGVITRAVKGRVDECPNGYFNKSEQWEVVNTPEYAYTLDDYIDNAKYIFQDRIASGEYGLQPDIFYFNFGQYSGTIAFKYIAGDASFDFYPMSRPAQDLKIEHPFDAGSNEWIITTPDGLKYHFSATETTQTNSPIDGLFTSAWYLSKIESTNSNEVLVLNYLPNSTNELMNYDKKIKTSTILPSKNPPGDPSHCPKYYEEADDPDEISTIYLSSIIYSQNGEPSITINLFSTKGDRCDEVGGYTPLLRTLYSIIITEENRNLIFDFDYGKFGDQNACTSANRLRLESVTENGKPPYLIEYNDIELPTYFAMTDHWGYWNGQNVPDNSSFIPTLPFEYASSYENNGLPAANRSSNAFATLAGLIKKITYPTGGYSEFNFEPHILASVKDGYKNYAHPHIVAYGDEFLHGEMNMEEEAWIDGYTDEQLVGGLPNVRIQSLYISEAQTVEILGNVGLLTQENEGQPPVYAAPTTFALYPSDANVGDDPLIIGSTPNYYTQIYLQPGHYKMVAGVASGNDLVFDEVRTDMTVNYYQIIDDYYTYETVGGARIASIITAENEDSDTKQLTEYKYIKDYIDGLKNHDEMPITSGVVHHSIPKYFHNQLCEEGLVATAFDSNPLGQKRGHHIGYSEVAVVKKSVNSMDMIDEGVTVYKYSNNANPDVRNLITSETYYKNDLLKTKKTTFEYVDHYPEEAIGYNFKVVEVVSLYCMGGCQYFNVFQDYIGENKFNYNSFWRTLSAKTDYYYMPDDDDTSLENRTDYDYYTNNYSLKNQIYYQLKTEEESISSNSKGIRKQFIYPPQKSAIYEDMTAANIYNQPVETMIETTDDDDNYFTIDGTKLLHNNFYGFYQPKEISKFNTNTDQYELKAAYNYDSYGNVIEISKMESDTDVNITDNFLLD